MIISLLFLEGQKDADTGKEEEDGEKKEKMEEDEQEVWSIEEKEKLLQFVTKVFLMNFPSYIAYKHAVHSSLEVSKSYN